MKRGLLLSLLMLTCISVSAELQKISGDGEILKSDSSEWSCVLDKKSSLMWEVKNEDEGLQYALNTYTWFDGQSGRDSGTYTKNCYWGKSCNTKSYIEDINQSVLCSFNDWRLPSRSELNSIVDYYGDSDTLINLDFFPNTQMDTYWTSSSLKDSPSLAYEIPFFFGGSIARDKTIDTFVRLVRSAD
jgi:hypothetical protein